MRTYIALLKWTPQGVQNVKQSPSRLAAARKGIEAAGVKMKDFYMVTGRYDMIVIIEAPDDGALAKALLTLASQGNIRSETCRAFTEDEYRQIIGGLAWNPNQNRQARTSADLQAHTLFCCRKPVWFGFRRRYAQVPLTRAEQIQDPMRCGGRMPRPWATIQLRSET